MAYEVGISPRAARQLRRLPRQEQTRVRQRIADLVSNPRPTGYRSLRDKPYYRVRVGDYRIIYDIVDDKLLVLVVLIGHRRGIYEQLDRL